MRVALGPHIDFAKYEIGQRVALKNLGVKNSRDYDDTDKIMAFDVVAEPPRCRQLGPGDP
jgi:hypothetical protein